jgi:hypothetical protein
VVSFSSCRRDGEGDKVGRQLPSLLRSGEDVRREQRKTNLFLDLLILVLLLLDRSLGSVGGVRIDSDVDSQLHDGDEARRSDQPKLATCCELERETRMPYLFSNSDSPLDEGLEVSLTKNL